MKKPSLLLIALAFIIIAATAVLLRRSQAGNLSQDSPALEEKELRALAVLEGRKRDRLEVLPKVINETPSLQITNMEIVRWETFDHLRITFHNYSDKAVNSFTICPHIDEYGWTADTFHAPPGRALIEPHSEISKMIPAGVFRPDKPLTICALMFVDETGEGLPDVRKSGKESYEERKQEAREEKP